MNRRPSSFRSLAVAAAADSSTSAAAMSSRPYFRGGRPQGRRGYSDRTSGPASGDTEFVSGDSHFRATQDANRGFRPSYKAVPPPPMYSAGQQFRGPVWQPYRPGPPVMQQFPGPRGPRPYRPRQVRPDFGNSQQFRPQQMPQQFRPQQMQPFRPRSPKPPDYREWDCAKPGPSPCCERFTILSYNILADYLATDHWHNLYFHIPRYIMDWNWRKRNISFELGLWSADILCFQEVDRFQDIEAELRPRGYNGIWKMRTGDPADGCAIFWRVSRFKLLHEESIEYNKLGLRDNVAQICVFESLSGQTNGNGASPLSSSSARSNRVIVCNIHVLFNPKRGDIKLGQIRVLLKKAHSTSKLWDDAPIVICGDFNCTPESPMYNFLKEQKLDLSELPRGKVSGQTSAEIRPSRPDFRGPAADGSTQASAVNYEKTEQGSTNSPPMGSYSIPGYSKAAEVRECVESNSQILSEGPDNSIKHPVLPNNPPSDIPKTSESVGSESSELEGPLERLSPNSLDVASSECVEVPLSVSAANDINERPSYESGFTLDEKFEELQINEVVNGTEDKLSEDCDSFLSELHSTGPDPLADLKLHGDEILNDNLYSEQGINSDMADFSFSSSAWTPAEIETATGSADTKVMEHPLKLTSAYAEVENSPESRDSSGEPLVTSYHRRFLGTVDYIWHSNGLQTAKVLAPIPKHVMQQTRGFPTRKWGSDHIALVSEFAFTKDISSENASQ